MRGILGSSAVLLPWRLHHAQVAAGLDGDADAVLKARTIFRELLGEVKLQLGEDGSLWTSYDFPSAVPSEEGQMVGVRGFVESMQSHGGS